MTPRNVKGRTWEMDTFKISAKEGEELEAIPGLWWKEGKVSGWVDAMAAACKVLKINWTPPPIEVPKLTLPADLLAHQAEGISKTMAILKKWGGCLLADDMGLGKTRQVLELAKLVGGRTVIVAKAAVRETWREEITKWWPEVKYHIVEPGKREFPADTKLLVVSQDDFARDYEPPFYADLLAIEEAHEMRGRDTKRAKAISAYANMCRLRLLITGTPIPNLPRDLWFPLSLAFGGAFGNGFNFNLRYAGARLNEHGGWEAKGASNLDELKMRLSFYMVRRTKAEVGLELPPLTRKVVWVDPSPGAAEAFKQSVLTKSTRLRQRAIEATMVGKYDAVVSLAKEHKPVVVMTWRHVDVKALVLKFQEAGLPCVAIGGDLTAKRRQKLIRAAQEARHSVIATIDSITTGVNMQAVASTGIMHKLDDVPLKMAQAEARLHRIGTLLPVTWFYPAMRESIDQVIVDRIIAKMDYYRNLLGRDSNTQLRDSLQDAQAEGQNDEELSRSILDELRRKHG